MISVNNNTKLLNGIISIEKEYQNYFGNEFDVKYIHLYSEQFDRRLSQLCASLHHQLIENLTILNTSINGDGHYWANPSRDLIKAISLSNRFISNLKNSGKSVVIVEYYNKVMKECKTFLSISGGSSVPKDMKEVDIYYILPIFEVTDTIQLPNQSSYNFQLKPIGSGSYASVYSYLDSSYNKTFAVKRAKKNISPKDLERFYLEFETMKKLSSPYLLEVYSIDKIKNEYVMEYADMTLQTYIMSQNQKLTFEERKSLCYQIIRGFEYLTEKEVLHRDIAPNNILIKEYEDTKIVKIADFGNVKLVDNLLTSVNTEIRGSFNDISGLQRIGFSNYDFKFEGFALCRLLYFVLTGRHKNFNKFPYSNLEQFMEKGTNPQLNQRFSDIYELKMLFSTIKQK